MVFMCACMYVPHPLSLSLCVRVGQKCFKCENHPHTASKYQLSIAKKNTKINNKYRASHDVSMRRPIYHWILDACCGRCVSMCMCMCRQFKLYTYDGCFWSINENKPHRNVSPTMPMSWPSGPLHRIFGSKSKWFLLNLRLVNKWSTFVCVISPSHGSKTELPSDTTMLLGSTVNRKAVEKIKNPDCYYYRFFKCKNHFSLLCIEKKKWNY